MEIAGSEAQVLQLEQVTAEVADSVEHWRAEICGQGVRRIDRSQLSVLLDRWRGGGFDPGLLAYVILGCEWLLRARRGALRDMRREVEQIEAALCNPRHGPLAADQAALLIDALRPWLKRQLEGRRFLVSLGLWAVRGRFSKWQAWITAKGMEGIVRPAPQVKKKRGGRIPTLAPIVAGCVAEAIAREHRDDDAAEPLGLAVAELLLRRAVPAGEYRRWGRNLDLMVEEEPDAESGAPPPMTARQWLTRRFEFGYRALRTRTEATALLQECRREPRKVFDAVANSEVVAILYALPWAAGSRSASGAAVS